MTSSVESQLKNNNITTTTSCELKNLLPVDLHSSVSEDDVFTVTSDGTFHADPADVIRRRLVIPSLVIDPLSVDLGSNSAESQRHSDDVTKEDLVKLASLDST
ncbi:uncharacterized protein V6R79_005325 [Siganus canaliculatus]